MKTRSERIAWFKARDAEAEAAFNPDHTLKSWAEKRAKGARASDCRDYWASNGYPLNLNQIQRTMEDETRRMLNQKMLIAGGH